MSYDKNTIIESHVDAIVRTLESLKHPYTIRSIDRVRCRGINDLGEIKIRRLEYGNRVVLERMVHTADCDADDVLESHEFSRAEDPGSRWRSIIELSDEDDWPSADGHIPEIDALRNTLRKLVSVVGGGLDHTDALNEARALLNKDRR